MGDRTLLEPAPNGLVSIVGTRDASSYGERMARMLSGAAALAGATVVSGMARGIDAAAHRAALEAGGRTIAVLGTGVDVPYPTSHRTLHQLVHQSGLVISEMEPGTRAFPGCFPRRNRLIARLAQVVVVVEAGFKSGAVNTANQAMEMGVPVAVVPGQMDDPRAAGSNRLLRDGAQPLTCVEDLLTLVGLSTSTDSAGASTALGAASELGQLDRFSQAERALWRLLGTRAEPIEQIAYSAGLTVSQVSEVLLKLEIGGLVQQDAGGYRRTG